MKYIFVIFNTSLLVICNINLYCYKHLTRMKHSSTVLFIKKNLYITQSLLCMKFFVYKIKFKALIKSPNKINFCVFYTYIDIKKLKY